jgi:hypothetical protein
VLAAQRAIAAMSTVATPRPRTAGSTHIEVSSARLSWSSFRIPVAMPTGGFPWASKASRSIAPGIDRRSRQRFSGASTHSCSHEQKAAGASVNAASRNIRHARQSTADMVRSSMVIPRPYRLARRRELRGSLISRASRAGWYFYLSIKRFFRVFLRAAGPSRTPEEYHYGVLGEVLGSDNVATKSLRGKLCAHPWTIGGPY